MIMNWNCSMKTVSTILFSVHGLIFFCLFVCFRFRLYMHCREALLIFSASSGQSFISTKAKSLPLQEEY